MGLLASLTSRMDSSQGTSKICLANWSSSQTSWETGSGLPVTMYACVCALHKFLHYAVYQLVFSIFFSLPPDHFCGLHHVRAVGPAQDVSSFLPGWLCQSQRPPEEIWGEYMRAIQTGKMSVSPLCLRFTFCRSTRGTRLTFVFFQALEKIAAYMKSDRFIKTPVNNKMAKWGNKKE